MFSGRWECECVCVCVVCVCVCKCLCISAFFPSFYLWVTKTMPLKYVFHMFLRRTRSTTEHIPLQNTFEWHCHSNTCSTGSFTETHSTTEHIQSQNTFEWQCRSNMFSPIDRVRKVFLFSTSGFPSVGYGVAAISRLLKIIGLFYRI